MVSSKWVPVNTIFTVVRQMNKNKKTWFSQRDLLERGKNIYKLSISGFHYKHASILRTLRISSKCEPVHLKIQLFSQRRTSRQHLKVHGWEVRNNYYCKFLKNNYVHAYTHRHIINISFHFTVWMALAGHWSWNLSLLTSSLKLLDLGQLFRLLPYKVFPSFSHLPYWTLWSCFTLECMGGERFAQWSQVTLP